MIKKNSVTKLQYFGERSNQIRSFFLNTIADLTKVNDEIEQEVGVMDETIADLQVNRDHLKNIKEENATLKEKLSSFFS